MTKKETAKKGKEEKKSLTAKAAKAIDYQEILLYPLSTEKSIRQIEFDNKLSFVVSSSASKQDVKKAVETMFKVKVAKVNMQNSIRGEKRATVKLTPQFLASDVSADLGLI